MIPFALSFLFPTRTAPPVSKKQRLGGNDYMHTSFGGRQDEAGHANTFATSYDNGDLEDDGDAADETSSPGGGSGDGARGEGAVTRKSKNKPWKIHRREGGGSMHDANLYRHYRPDFRELAREYPGKTFTAKRRQTGVGAYCRLSCSDEQT